MSHNGVSATSRCLERLEAPLSGGKIGTENEPRCKAGIEFPGIAKSRDCVPSFPMLLVRRFRDLNYNERQNVHRKIGDSSARAAAALGRTQTHSARICSLRRYRSGLAVGAPTFRGF